MSITLPTILLAIALLLVVISAVQPLARRLLVSDAVLLAVVGTLIGAVAVYLLETPRFNLLNTAASAVVHLPINAEAFLFIFLPILVFHGALSIDVRRLARDAAPVLMMAVVAVLVTTAAIGLVLAPIAGLPLAACLMFGSIVATTDPSAVIAVFRDIGADGRLTRLVEGEALLNDAAAISLFSILLGAVTYHRGIGLLDASWLLLASFGGGVAVGYVLSRVMLYAIPLLGGSRSAEVTLTLALPYVAYIVADQFLGVSGVVAAACAGLTVSAIGPSTFRPQSWAFLTEVWAQLSFWASSLIFILASMLVPRLIIGVSRVDLGLLGVVTAAALTARAAVLFGLLPLLTAARLCQRVPTPFKVTMLWGGLRGAITLALALSVTENPAVSPAVQHMVAILATGFVLVTLLVGGTTLRFVVGWLRLDQLSPIDQALRHQVVAIGLAEVRDRLRQAASDFGFSRPVMQRVMGRFAQRIETEAAANEFDRAITDRDRIKLGLITLASRERTVLLEMFRDRALSRPIMEYLLWTAESMVDGARSAGRLGYIRAARRRLRPSMRFRLAQWMHRVLRLDRPLMHAMAERFEMLLLMRLVSLSLNRFMRRRMEPVLGKRVSDIVAEVAERRRDLMEDAMETLRLQYPGYAEALELRVLRQIGLRMEGEEYENLQGESLIGEELRDELVRDVEARRDRIARPLKFSLQIGLDQRVREIPVFAHLQEAILHDIAMNVSIRFTAPGEPILRRKARPHSVFFISSGEVEFQHDGHTVKLGRGDVIGDAEVLERRRYAATIRASSFSHLLEMRAEDFRRLVAENPELVGRLETARTRHGGASVVSRRGPIALLGFEPKPERAKPARGKDAATPAGRTELR